MTTKHWTNQYADLLEEGAVKIVNATPKERKQIAKAVCTFYHSHEREQHCCGPFGEEMVHAIHSETDHGKAEIKITFRLLWRIARLRKLVDPSAEIPELEL